MRSARSGSAVIARASSGYVRARCPGGSACRSYRRAAACSPSHHCSLNRTAGLLDKSCGPVKHTSDSIADAAGDSRDKEFEAVNS